MEVGLWSLGWSGHVRGRSGVGSSHPNLLDQSHRSGGGGKVPFFRDFPCGGGAGGGGIRRSAGPFPQPRGVSTLYLRNAATSVKSSAFCQGSYPAPTRDTTRVDQGRSFRNNSPRHPSPTVTSGPFPLRLSFPTLFPPERRVDPGPTLPHRGPVHTHRYPRDFVVSAPPHFKTLDPR